MPKTDASWILAAMEPGVQDKGGPAGEAALDCVIPAAGLSSRMGSWKPLLAWKGRPLIDWAVAAALEACGRVILVTGHRGTDLEARFSGNPRVFCVPNPRYEQGLFSSIQCGAGQVQTAAFFVALADMPALPAAIFSVLAQARKTFVQAGPASMPPLVLRPSQAGRHGHPVLLDRSVVPLILREPPGSSMKTVLRSCRVELLPVDDPGVVFDVDRPEDLR